MRRFLLGGLLSVFLLLGCLWALPAGAASAPVTEPGNPPGQESQTTYQLVLLLVVDQLPAYLLERYDSLYSGGFRRLLGQGLAFTRATHDHAATETSPGHATLSTGVHPARHGVVGNTWREVVGNELQLVVNVLDESERVLGADNYYGSSPRVLRREGLADWVAAADPDSRVVSLSAKDRAAILLAGQTLDEVYWFDSAVGRFVTSTYYREEYPAWVDAYNARLTAEYVADTVWTSQVPPALASLSGGDTASYEGDGVHTFFPHRYREEADTTEEGAFSIWWSMTPMVDEAVLDLAREAVRELDLGGDGHLDFLAVSLSQTDWIGHDYGPLSREQLDNLLRLDRHLGSFLDFLDDQVGRDRYLVGFSSDHGTMPNPERLREMGQDAQRLTAEHREATEAAVAEAISEAQSLREGDPLALVADRLQELPWVGPAYGRDELNDVEPPDSFRVLFRNSYLPDRMGGILSRLGIELWWTENTVDWGRPLGTTHGSPYLYDRHVPLVLMGAGIEPGRTDERVATVDLAPTLAQLVGISFPADLDGRPLIRW